MTILKLTNLEKEAGAQGYLLRLQVRRPLNLWTLRLVVGNYKNPSTIQLLGELKAWAYPMTNGLQLDTMQIRRASPPGIGHLVWAATMAWALEETPCRKARLLAINDDEFQHRKLVRYFLGRGFKEIREVGSAPLDLPLRMVWGGAGTLMSADCNEVYRSSLRLWKASQQIS